MEFSQTSIVKCTAPIAENYFKLSFEFELKSQDLGKSVYFCYAKPYGYSDLLADLDLVREQLMRPMQQGDPPKLKVLPKSDEQQTKANSPF